MNILFLVHSTVQLWREDKGQLVGGHSLCPSQWSRESNSCYTAWLSSSYLCPLNHLTLSTLFFKTRSFFHWDLGLKGLAGPALNSSLNLQKAGNTAFGTMLGSNHSFT